MGVVWQACNLQTRQQVALKVIHTVGAADRGEVERFLTEARAGARLQHPHIVRVFHFDVADGQPYFTMELVPYGTLEDRLTRGPLTPRQAARLMQQAAQAIHYAHEQKVLHRDLKPSNLLLTAAGAAGDTCVAGRSAAKSHHFGEGTIADAELAIKVADFGLARLQDATQHVTAAGDRFGTPSYMAPEQAKTASRDVRTDVYGLGAVLYACLTGRPPFQAATPAETVFQVQHNEPLPVRALTPATPRELEAVCLKCLEKDPARRYASAGALADDLGRWLDGQPVQARPISQGVRLLRWVKRHALVTGLAAALMLLLVTSVIVSSYFAITASREAARADDTTAEVRLALLRANEQLDKTERARYVGQLAQAQREFRDGNPARGVELLGQCRREFRGVEHHLLWTRYRPLQTYGGCPGGAFSAVFRPDGGRIAAGTGNGAVAVWKADTGRQLWCQPGHDQAVSSVVYSPDGKRLYSAGGAFFNPPKHGDIKVWDADTGRVLQTLVTTPAALFGIACDGDGLRLVGCGADRLLKVWDAASGKELLSLPGHQSDVMAVQFRPDGARFVSGGQDRAIKI